MIESSKIIGYVVGGRDLADRYNDVRTLTAAHFPPGRERRVFAAVLETVRARRGGGIELHHVIAALEADGTFESWQAGQWIMPFSPARPVGCDLGEARRIVAAMIARGPLPDEPSTPTEEP